LHAVNSITEHRESIVQLGIDQFCQSSFWLGINADESLKKKTINALHRDLSRCLLLVRAGIFAGDNEVIESIIVEFVASVETPASFLVEAIRFLENACLTLLSQDEGVETELYFDYIISVFKSYKDDPVSTKSAQKIKPSKLNSQDIWISGEVAIAFASGGAFLGGLIANLPGAVAGALIGGIFGWFTKADAASYPKTSE
jgi:Phycobilisome protein